VIEGFVSDISGWCVRNEVEGQVQMEAASEVVVEIEGKVVADFEVFFSLFRCYLDG
jgi:hypothetical protein